MKLVLILLSFLFIVKRMSSRVVISDEFTTTPLSQENEWKNINISLPLNTSHQTVGYESVSDTVWLLGGINNEKRYWSLTFSESYRGWNESYTGFNNVNIMQYQQSSVSSKNNIIYIKIDQYIQIFDMKWRVLYENVIELPSYLTNGCMTVFYSKTNVDIEYLIVIGNNYDDDDDENDIIRPTTWIYKIDRLNNNVTFFDVGPDLIAKREGHCCVIMDDILYVVGGKHKEGTFIEEWNIDIEADAYNINSSAKFDNFRNIFTLIDKEIANINLPQFGHRCLVNENQKYFYVIGGITNEENLYFNFSKYVFILSRINDSLYEINYSKDNKLNDKGLILSSLPNEIAYTSIMMDKYGYLNVFGGELSSGKLTNIWWRINTKNKSISNDTDIIWRKHHKHNHNEQWALLILLIMIILIALWFKCVERLSKLRKEQRNAYADTYDEITNHEDIDDISDDIDNDDIDDIEDYVDSPDDHNIQSSDLENN